MHQIGSDNKRLLNYLSRARLLFCLYIINIHTINLPAVTSVCDTVSLGPHGAVYVQGHLFICYLSSSSAGAHHPQPPAAGGEAAPPPQARRLHPALSTLPASPASIHVCRHHRPAVPCSERATTQLWRHRPPSVRHVSNSRLPCHENCITVEPCRLS